jgi:hypothetical protein
MISGMQSKTTLGDSDEACEDGADDQHDLSDDDTISRVMCG